MIPTHHNLDFQENHMKMSAHSNSDQLLQYVMQLLKAQEKERKEDR